MEKKPALISLPTLLMAVALLALVLVGGAAASRLLNTPLAEPLNLQTVPQPAAAQPDVEAAPVLQAEGLCGETGTMTVLFVGADFSGGTPPPGADAVRVIRYNFDQQAMSIAAFPRDLWLKVDGLKDQGKPQERLGLSYHLKKQSAGGTEHEKITAATNLVAQTLYDNFDVLPEHYFTLQLDSVQAMVDTIGGVEITLPETITTEHGITFPAGVQTLDGYLSAHYLRAFYPGGEAARLQRQNLYINALRNRVLGAGVIARTPDLIEQFNEAIVTDLTPTQLANLACAMEKIPSDAAAFYEIGGDMVIVQKDGSLHPVMGKIKQMLDDAFDLKKK